MNILIVDDNPTNRKLIRAQLEAKGHVVMHAEDGMEALKVLDLRQIDAVISDVLMPRMDGYRLCEEIRRSARHHGLPTIIYSSTFTSPEDVQRAMEAGADKYVSKPASIEVLMAALNEIKAIPYSAPKAGPAAEVDKLNKYSERLVKKLAAKKEALEVANAELLATRDQLAHLLKHSPAVLYSLDLKGKQVMPQLMSDAVTRMLGMAPGESGASEWWQTHLHPADQEFVLAGIRKTFEAGTSESEYRLRHQAGHYLWVRDNRRLVRNAAGDPTGLVGVWTDITERKQMEKQERHAQRLESIGTLACGVVHDLNNVLMPILFTAELLRNDCPQHWTELIDLIETSAARGAEMVKSLLLFARGIEGDSLVLRPESLVKELEKLVNISFPKKITLRTVIGLNLPSILGDPTQLGQVLLNLCINARDAMPAGGTIVVTVEKIELDPALARGVAGARAGPYVSLSVQDMGTGIRPELLERIFEPFFTTKGPGIGTGLGLSTVSGIVKSHGGFLQVSSELGHGSRFTVYLPAAGPGDDQILLVENEQSLRGCGQTILVVDDDAGMRNSLRKMLTRLNFKVLSAADGMAALLQVADNRADLRIVITDLSMPNMDGLTFARVLKAKLPAAGIIVVSGTMDAGAAAAFKELGVVQLDKPFAPEKLLEMIHRLLPNSNRA